jgi:hypothetical protein
MNWTWQLRSVKPLSWQTRLQKPIATENTLPTLTMPTQFTRTIRLTPKMVSEINERVRRLKGLLGQLKTAEQ